MILQNISIYEDFINTYDKLYHIKTDESFDEVFNMICSTILGKYQLSTRKVITSIINAIKYNYRSINVYIPIINMILEKYTFDFSKIQEYFDGIPVGISYTYKNDEIINVMIYANDYPSKNTVKYMIMNDKIEEFKEYMTQNSIDDIVLRFSCFKELKPIEACALFGSVNIFYFIYLDLKQDITKRCFQFSLIGGNIDIINECMKLYDIDADCMKYGISSHNNQFIEYILEKDPSYVRFFDINDVIESQNLKSVFLLINKNDDAIIPFCSAFSQTIEFFKCNNYDFSKVDDKKRTLLHYACLYNSDEACKTILKYPEIYKSILNSRDCNGKTPLHIAICLSLIHI